MKVTISSLFRLTHTFTVMFGSPGTRVLSSVPTTAFFWVLFLWMHNFTARLLYYSYISVKCSILSLGPLQASEMRSFEKLFSSFTCYLLSQQVTCYVLPGFCNSPVYLFTLLFSYHYYYLSQRIYV